MYNHKQLLEKLIKSTFLEPLDYTFDSLFVFKQITLEACNMVGDQIIIPINVINHYDLMFHACIGRNCCTFIKIGVVLGYILT